jgi:hypothetical protein
VCQRSRVVWRRFDPACRQQSLALPLVLWPWFRLWSALVVPLFGSLQLGSQLLQLFFSLLQTALELLQKTSAAHY